MPCRSGITHGKLQPTSSTWVVQCGVWRARARQTASYLFSPFRHSFSHISRGSARFVTRASPPQARAPQARHKGRAPRLPSDQITAPRPLPAAAATRSEINIKQRDLAARTCSAIMGRDPSWAPGHHPSGASADTALEGTPQKSALLLSSPSAMTGGRLDLPSTPPRTGCPDGPSHPA